mmetsp:Transcript_21393/g.27664  ORF Transcript_21393/g.27664 Transcript_21393/m.27664 type:complete len:191 (+) Transcript_21393:40-612(+)
MRKKKKRKKIEDRLKMELKSVLEVNMFEIRSVYGLVITVLDDVSFLESCLWKINNIFCLGGFYIISDLFGIEKETGKIFTSSMLNEGNHQNDMVTARKYFVTDLLEEFLFSKVKAVVQLYWTVPYFLFNVNGDKNEYGSRYYFTQKLAVHNSITSSDINWEPFADRGVEFVNSLEDEESSRRRSILLWKF